MHGKLYVTYSAACLQRVVYIVKFGKYNFPRSVKEVVNGRENSPILKVVVGCCLL